MAYIKKNNRLSLPERFATPVSVYVNRRGFLKSLGLAGIGSWFWLNGCFGNGEPAAQGLNSVSQTIPAAIPPYPLARNPLYTADRPLTSELVAAAYNNYYEFTTDKDQVWKLAQGFEITPWKIEISGEVHKPLTIDIDDLLKKMPLEERVYRHRCVEAWSMVVPWSGFALRDLIKLAEPTSAARYLRFVSFYRPGQAKGQKAAWYPWPYYEGLSMAEASHDLAFMATGVYGHPLPKQHGAPLRLATPWKYGFKSIKGIVKIEFLRERPKTFWNDLAPAEYSFSANVNPAVPHPRWSQATERVIDTGERIPTRMFNGYADQVAELYRKG